MRDDGQRRDVRHARPVGNPPRILLPKRRNLRHHQRAPRPADHLQSATKRHSGAAARTGHHHQPQRGNPFGTGAPGGEVLGLLLRTNLFQPGQRQRHPSRAEDLGVPTSRFHPESHRRRCGEHRVFLHPQHSGGGLPRHGGGHPHRGAECPRREGGVEGHQTPHLHHRRQHPQRPSRARL